MVRRINAFKKIFNLLLTIVELLIGVVFLLNIFGSSEAIGSLRENVHSMLEQLDSGTSTVASSISIEGPASFLILVIGFLIFSFVLLTMVPNATKRMKREIQEEFDQ